ncbi:MAG TPA: prolipoprotein diacylglyceryl transferase [Woeseiaceae bacterium]|nr:prolipoprotein diacylglyceryl transferase [Woeseiaceae bacterium]
MLPYPDIDPVIFSIGPLKLRWYGLMYVIGFVLGWWLARRRAARPHSPISPAQVDDLVFYAMIGVVVGGRLGYSFIYAWDRLLADPLYVLRIWEGGMSFHGGLLGVIVAVWLFGRRVGRGFFEMSDFLAPLVPPGLGFGRIGNFINGELWGKPTDVPWSFDVGGIGRHPSQLYEALLEGLVLFVILWTFSAKPRPTMAVSGLFLACYGVFRFFIEFYRLPDENIGYLAFGWLTMGQVLSTPMILAGIVLLALAYRRETHQQAA